MSREKNHPIDDRDLQRFYDLNLSGFWWHSGAEWTSLIKDEATFCHQEISPEKEAQAIHKPVLYSVLAIFLLLIGAALTRSGNFLGTATASTQNSTEQIIFNHK
ncbi:hypothetical protein [Calothrix sp. UHCC 0171]|uniref:hypothetical protein n=1 Tax=Calothrix sp. UHCC 0171 TaxID=3110245 RepID=UPI002B21DD3C|nr:hypothetical protein [Calothrix sp. UHCC 0171]MEA5572780.1 hypothetical protein [Calothrix sp. UHCC 0171]